MTNKTYLYFCVGAELALAIILIVLTITEDIGLIRFALALAAALCVQASVKGIKAIRAGKL
jgi:hypothetical protein